jgi:hypothetical protein
MDEWPQRGDAACQMYRRGREEIGWGRDDISHIFGTLFAHASGNIHNRNAFRVVVDG